MVDEPAGQIGDMPTMLSQKVIEVDSDRGAHIAASFFAENAVRGDVSGSRDAHAGRTGGSVAQLCTRIQTSGCADPIG